MESDHSDMTRLDIMAVTSEQMESGYKKIHRWCLFEFRQFTKDTQLEVSPVMSEALRRLGSRPNLLKSVDFQRGERYYLLTHSIHVEMLSKL